MKCSYYLVSNGVVVRADFDAEPRSSGEIIDEFLRQGVSAPGSVYACFGLPGGVHAWCRVGLGIGGPMNDDVSEDAVPAIIRGKHQADVDSGAGAFGHPTPTK
ncbi:MAG TPA: hypothetical protein VFS43_46755 [Polyangiaceae bacterium]|nr:hypothetical protein [Polyangiaceae bacterium]